MEIMTFYIRLQQFKFFERMGKLDWVHHNNIQKEMWTFPLTPHLKVASMLNLLIIYCDRWRSTTQWTKVHFTFLVRWFLQFLTPPTNIPSIQLRDHCFPVSNRSTCQEIPDSLQPVVLPDISHFLARLVISFLNGKKCSDTVVKYFLFQKEFPWKGYY